MHDFCERCIVLLLLRFVAHRFRSRRRSCFGNFDLECSTSFRLISRLISRPVLSVSVCAPYRRTTFTAAQRVCAVHSFTFITFLFTRDLIPATTFLRCLYLPKPTAQNALAAVADHHQAQHHDPPINQALRFPDVRQPRSGGTLSN